MSDDSDDKPHTIDLQDLQQQADQNNNNQQINQQSNKQIQPSSDQIPENQQLMNQNDQNQQNIQQNQENQKEEEEQEDEQDNYDSDDDQNKGKTIKYVQTYQCLMQSNQLSYIMVSNEDWSRLQAMHFPRYLYYQKKSYFEKFNNVPGICQVRKYDDSTNSLVLNFGVYTLKELNDYRFANKKQWTGGELIYLLQQMIEILQKHVQSKAYFGDWKPENIVFYKENYDDPTLSIQVNTMNGMDIKLQSCYRVTHAYWEPVKIANKYVTVILRLREEYLRIGRTIQRLMINAVAKNEQEIHQIFKNGEKKPQQIWEKITKPYQKHKEFLDFLYNLIFFKAYEIETQLERCKKIPGAEPIKYDEQFSIMLCQIQFSHIYKQIESMGINELTRELYYCYNIGMSDKGAKVCQRLLKLYDERDNINQDLEDDEEKKLRLEDEKEDKIEEEKRLEKLTQKPQVKDSQGRTPEEAAQYLESQETQEQKSQYLKKLEKDVNAHGGQLNRDQILLWQMRFFAKSQKLEKATRHYQRLQRQRMNKYGLSEGDEILLFDDPIMHAEYLDLLSKIYYKKKLYDQAIDFAQQSINVKLENLYVNHPQIHQNVYLMAKISYKQTNYQETLEYLQPIVEDVRKMYSNKDYFACRVYYKMGQTLYMLSMYKQAAQFYEAALEVKMNTYGEYSLSTANLVNSLGTALIFSGEYKRAEEKLKHALKIEQYILGNNSYMVATTLSNLGSFQLMMNNLNDAEQNLERAFEIEEEKYGSEHISQLGTLTSQGLLNIYKGYYKMGFENLQLAEKILRRRRLYRKALAENTMPEYEQMIKLEQDEQNWQDFENRLQIYYADQHRQQLQEKYKDMMESQRVERIKKEVAQYMEDERQKEKDRIQQYEKRRQEDLEQQKLKKKTKKQLKMEEQQEKQKEKDRKEEEELFNDIDFENRCESFIQYHYGVFYLQTGKYQESYDKLKQAEQQFIQFFGPRHQNLAVIYNHLGMCLQLLGRKEEGIQVLQTAINIMVENFGPEHHDSLNSKCKLGYLYMREGQFKEAEEIITPALKIMEAASYTNRELIYAYSCMGYIAAQKEDWEQTEKYMEQARDLFEQSYHHNIENLDLAFILCYLGKAYLYSGHSKDGDRSLIDSQRIRKIYLQPDQAMFQDYRKYIDVENRIFQVYKGKCSKECDMHPPEIPLPSKEVDEDEIMRKQPMGLHGLQGLTPQQQQVQLQQMKESKWMQEEKQKVIDVRMQEYNEKVKKRKALIPKETCVQECILWDKLANKEKFQVCVNCKAPLKDIQRLEDQNSALAYEEGKIIKVLNQEQEVLLAENKEIEDKLKNLIAIHEEKLNERKKNCEKLEQEAKELERRSKECKSVQQCIDDKNKQITALEENIKEINAKQDQLKVEIEEKKNKLEQQKASQQEYLEQAKKIKMEEIRQQLQKQFKCSDNNKIQSSQPSSGPIIFSENDISQNIEKASTQFAKVYSTTCNGVQYAQKQYTDNLKDKKKDEIILYLSSIFGQINNMHHLSSLPIPSQILPLQGLCIMFKEQGILNLYLCSTMQEQNLQEFLNQNPNLSIIHQAIILHQLAIAIQFLASNQLVHGNIKPQNIYINVQKTQIGNTFEVKLGDFGCAQIAKQFVGLKAEIETYDIRYTAPEVLQSEEAKPESDVWSFGCVMFYLITGQKPWGQNNQNKLIEKSINSEQLHLSYEEMFRGKSQFDKRFQNMIEFCTRKDADKRIKSNNLVNLLGNIIEK